MAMLLTLCCCKGGRDGNTDADTERIARLTAMDDSIRVSAPSIKDSLRNAMRNAKDSTEWAEYAVRMAKIYFKENKADSLTLYLNSVKKRMGQMPQNARTRSITGLAYEFEAGWKQLTQWDNPEVMRLHKKAYSLINESDNKDYLSDIAANIGDCYYLNNNMPKAASYYRRALFLVDSLQLPKEKNTTLYMGLARIYENLGDLEEAERFYKQSEKNLDKISQGMRTYFLCSIGGFYYKEGQYEKANTYFRRMEKFVAATEGENSFNMALCRINSADVYLNMGDPEKAELYLGKAEPFFRNNNIGGAIYYATTIRMGILLKKKRYAEVEKLLREEKEATGVEHAVKKIRNSYLRQYYVATGNYAAAYANITAEDKTDDSIARSNSYMRASEVIQRFSEDTLALHHDIAMAEKERKADEAAKAIILLSAGIVILLLAFAVWWMYIRKKQLADKMERFLLRLENTRNRISPHFIFNILNNRIYTAGQKEKDELMALAQLIRKSLDISRDTFITLSEELDFVMKYVEVQSYILRPDFKFSLNTPDNISGIYIPAMSIQILAENAIKHGLKGLEREQELTINVERTEHGIRIAVEDNGRGFDSTKGSGNGLGMNIIRQTMAAVNRSSKRGRMDMDIRNKHNADGQIAGCVTTITIEGKIKTKRL